MFEVRYYQAEAEQSIFDYFGSGQTGNPVIAMPTGTGKSIVIAKFINNVFRQWSNQRVMMLTHVKELIGQNRDKMLSVWPTAPLGIYSAGLNCREMIMPIVFGGIQSVAPAIKRSLESGRSHFGHRDLVIIDEAHLLGPDEDTQYQYVIAELKKINPYLKVIGLTATPYRMKQGMITDGGLFTDICYDITGVESFNRLIAEGYLCPIIAKRTKTEVDVSRVDIVAGEFNKKELEKEVDEDKIVIGAVNEILEIAANRSAWLVFATGIDNTEHLASVFQSYGVDILPVHSKLPAKVNDERIRAFKAGEIRGLVNGQKLTTGFDHPPIDFIGDLNPTMSPGKHVQKLGRGTRPSVVTGKVNCLYADFSGNVKRIGPINDPRIPNKPGKGNGDVPIKICPQCGIYNHAAVRFCNPCGFEFPFETKLYAEAGTLEPLRDEAPVVEYFNVQKVIYNYHEKAGSKPSLKVSYFCGLQMFNEWVCIEHSGPIRRRVQDWWKQRHRGEVPTTVKEALSKISELRTPAKIRVWLNKKYPEVLSAEW